MSRFERGQRAYIIGSIENGEAGVFGTQGASDLMQENISALTGGRARFNRQSSNIPSGTSVAKHEVGKDVDLSSNGAVQIDDSHFVHEGYIFVKVSPGKGTTQITIGDEVHHVLRIG